MSELMLVEQFDASAREFADGGKNPDNGPYRDQPLKHEMWLSVYHRRVAELEGEARFAREAA